MKMTKSQMKQIVKECIIEILSEGLGSFVPRADNSKQLSQAIQPSIYQDSSRSHPVPQTAARKPTQQLQPHLYEAAKRNSGGNKIMESILLDTAATTLNTMISNGDSAAMPQQGVSPSMGSQEEKFNGTPEQVFGEEASSKWANLAFMGSNTKK